MRKLNNILFILLFANGVYCQVVVETITLSDSRYQFINKNTKQKINSLVWDEAESFVNGFAKVATGDKWGYVDRMGNPVISPSYETVRNFVNNLAAVNKNSKWGFIDEKGFVIIPIEYDIVYDFAESVTVAYKNNKWFLINKQGSIINSLDIDVCWGFRNGSARITKQGRSGIINTKGEIISIEDNKPILAEKLNGDVKRNNLVQSAPCPDNIGFELGNFTNWNSFIGSVAAVNNINVVTVSPSPPTVLRHEIYPSKKPSALDPYGLFPTNPPDGSGFALKLGNNMNGRQAERVSYLINVPANSTDASITYRYAVVFQDPGHQIFEQPRFSAKLKDVQTNSYLPCASYEYISGDGLPGFYDSPVDPSIKCRTWSSVFINLSVYAGKSLILEFTTADCTKGAHWGYSYVDVGDCNIAASIDYHCNPSIAYLDAPPGFQSYYWWDESYSTILKTGQNISLSPAPALNSTLHVEVIPFNGFGCKDTLDVTVKTNHVSINAGPDTAICVGGSARIGTAEIIGNIYSWSPALNLSNPKIASPIASPKASTNYTLTVIHAADGCTDQDNIYVTVHPNPIIELGKDLTLITGTNYQFNPEITHGPIISWNWMPSSNLNCNNCPNPLARIKGDITYHSYIKNINGCLASDSVYIHAICTKSQIFIPNAFSPDGDGINDVLMVRASGIELVHSFRIFSRWGELIFEKNNFLPNLPAYGWDGRIRGVTGPAEVYVYIADVTCENKQRFTLKGNVTLLK